ncbi:MAG: hypothetical protein VKI42_00365 [Synechococcaceae cyanobacterium]|nr:hypothetical protein [Synechococcaceae cyanobacterium]
MPNLGESSQLDRYAAIEAAYRSGDWDTVLEQGTVLNRKLARVGGANAQALRQRLELMLAHTHLYGFGDAESAQGHYQALLNQPVEASLRQMAEEGLQQCRNRIAATASGSGDPATTTVDPGDGAAAQEPPNPSEPQKAAAAEPWLADLNANLSSTDNNNRQPTNPFDRSSDSRAETKGPNPGDTLIPEVIEEPELLEVHQADSRLAEEVDLTPEPSMATTVLTSLAAAAQAELSGTSAELGEEEFGNVDAAPAAEEPDPELLACLRLVRLS